MEANPRIKGTNPDMKTKTVFFTRAVLSLSLMLSCACTIMGKPSPPPDYFMLSAASKISPAEETLAAKGPEGRAGSIPVIVGPVEVASYLDRPQIIRMSSGSRLLFSEGCRWAEPLERGIERVVSTQINRKSLGFFAARPFSLNTPIEGGFTGYRVIINCYGFEEHSDGKVILDAEWTISTPGKDIPLVEKRASFASEAAGSTTEHTVEAMNRALAQLSAAIEKDLISLQNRAFPSPGH